MYIVFQLISLNSEGAQSYREANEFSINISHFLKHIHS